MDNPVTGAVLGFFQLIWSLGGYGGAKASPNALGFSQPEIRRTADKVEVCGQLQGAVNARVARVIQTGTPVQLVIVGRLTAGDHGGRFRSVTAIRLDTLTSQYTVSRGSEQQRFAKLEDATGALSRYCLEFATTPASGPVDLYAEASLDYPSALGIPDAASGLWEQATPYLRIRGIPSPGESK